MFKHVKQQSSIDKNTFTERNKVLYRKGENWYLISAPRSKLLIAAKVVKLLTADKDFLMFYFSI